MNECQFHLTFHCSGVPKRSHYGKTGSVQSKEYKVKGYIFILLSDCMILFAKISLVLVLCTEQRTKSSFGTPVTVVPRTYARLAPPL